MPARMASVRARSRDRSSMRAAEFLRRAVERARHGAQFVLAVVVRRTAEVAGGVPLRHRRHRFHAARQRRRERPREDERGHQRGDERQRVALPIVGELRVDVGEGQRQAHVRHHGMIRAHGHVDHVGLQRGAVALAGADAATGRGQDLGPRRVVLERGQFGRRLRRIADHAAVAGDQRDAARDQRAEPVGLAVHVALR